MKDISEALSIGTDINDAKDFGGRTDVTGDYGVCLRLDDTRMDSAVSGPLLLKKATVTAIPTHKAN